MNCEINTARLAEMIPRAEWDRVLNSDSSAEIDGHCLTCLDYTPFAYLIPEHWTVIDFGCSYNAQAYLFEHHQRLISVDLPFSRYKPEYHFERFKPPWCELYEMSIKEFLGSEVMKTLTVAETFAICGYVPASIEVALVRERFPNLFVYYPAGTRRAMAQQAKEPQHLAVNKSLYHKTK